MSQKRVKSERSVPFSERETRKLIELYLENKENYHSKFKSGSKSGLSVRHQLLLQWSKEISDMGIAFRSKESIEEKLRNEVKKVQRHLRQEKEKYTGTGGGSFRMTTLPQYLQPLADALAEKHHICGVPGIDDNCGDERDGEADNTNMNDVEMQEGEDDVATRPASQECPGLSNEADSVPSSSRQRSAAAVARESLSLFSDKRKELFEEEIKLARLKQRKIQLEIEIAELKKEEAKLQLDAAKAGHVSTNSTAPAPAPSSSITSPFEVYYQNL